MNLQLKNETHSSYINARVNFGNRIFNIIDVSRM